MTGHAAHDVRTLQLTFDGLDACHLPWSGYDGLPRARGAVAVRVLAWIVDIEARMAVVLHAAHIQATRDEFSDEPLDERGLA